MVTVSREMHCPADAVLAVLADGWSYGLWVVGSSRIRAVDRTWPAEGSRIAHSFGIWPLVVDDVTIVRHWDPVGGLELQARGWPAGEAWVLVGVLPLGPDRCLVQLSEDARRGPGVLVPRPVRSAVIRPRNIEALRRLAMLAERRSPAASEPG